MNDMGALIQFCSGFYFSFSFLFPLFIFFFLFVCLNHVCFFVLIIIFRYFESPSK